MDCLAIEVSPQKAGILNTMNTKILQFGFLPIQREREVNRAATESVSSFGVFFSCLKGLVNSVQKVSPHTLIEQNPQQYRSFTNAHSHDYLESLRKGLVSKGGPLQRISLRLKDFSLLQTFLFHCGFSQEEVKGLARDLLEGNPSREIDLHQFFRKVTELYPDQRKCHQPVILEPSSIPYIESALRYCGLTQERLGQAFGAARTEGGGVDLGKFVTKLKEISERITEGNRLPMDLDSIHQISENLKKVGVQLYHTKGGNLIPKDAEEKGLQIPNEGYRGRISEDFVKVVIQTSHNENNVRISLTDVIGALEQAAGGTKGERQLPPQVEAVIEKILERAVVSESKVKPIAPFSCPSRFQEINQTPKDTLHKEVKSFEGERPSPLLGEKCIGKPTSQVPSGLDIYEGFKRLGREDEEVIKWDTRIRGIVGNPRNSAISGLNNPAIQNRDPIVNTLPAYLIDQVGKWVSRAMLRGERVIRLQLRPPELGAMKVEMDMKGNVLKLGITTENGAVKELLLTNVHELRETLVEQGIKLGRIDVQINHHFDESLENSEERFKGGQRWVHELNREPTTKESSMEDTIASPLAMVAGTYLLNLIA